MSIQETNTNEKINPTNGWQNIGIMFKYAKKNIPNKYISTFMFICDESFGYCQKKTYHKPNKFWCELIDISKPTFQAHVKFLAKENHIMIVHKKGYVKNGGSNAYAYAPIFPKNFGQIFISENKTSIKKESKQEAYDRKHKNTNEQF